MLNSFFSFIELLSSAIANHFGITEYAHECSACIAKYTHEYCSSFSCQSYVRIESELSMKNLNSAYFPRANRLGQTT